MWDPRNYRDTVFGIGEDESFELPDSDLPDDLDLTQPHIMTVLGPIAPDRLGICQHREPILSNPAAHTDDDPDYCLDRIDLAREELEAFATAGGRSMVDATTIDCGRGPAGLRSIAQRLPVNIVVVAGRHPHVHAARMSNALDQGSIERDLVADFEAETKPGLIVAGTSLGEITAVERVAVMACANVAARTGYPLAVQLVEGTMAHETLHIVHAAGIGRRGSFSGVSMVDSISTTSPGSPNVASSSHSIGSAKAVAKRTSRKPKCWSAWRTRDSRIGC